MTQDETGGEDDLEREPDAEAGSLKDEDEGSALGRTVPHTGGFPLPAGFAQSLMPNVEGIAARMLAPLQEQMKAAMPDVDVLAKELLESFNDHSREQMASIVASFPTFSVPAIEIPALQGLGFRSATESVRKQIADEGHRILEGFRGSLEPLFDPALLSGFNRAFLPPNLRGFADEIQAHQVHEFLEQEGIPLYLVPRGRTALRLLRAPDRSGRRRVLGDCYESIIDDCAAVLKRSDQTVVGDEVRFALDGLGAMRVGHFRSAQAMFTVTLDTLIYRFYPDRAARGIITNRKKGAEVPDTIDEMGVHEAMVWLPIWNAHEQFWMHKGDVVPRYYSRHASVHGVSARQFSKRNCVQVLMLVTSLIGYADQLMASNTRTSA